jgi:hypothetical protein
VPERAFLLKGTIDDVVDSVRGGDAKTEDDSEGEDEGGEE